MYFVKFTFLKISKLNSFKQGAKNMLPIFSEHSNTFNSLITIFYNEDQTSICNLNT